MADIRITPDSSVMAFTSSLNFTQRIIQDPSGSLVLQGSGSLNRTNLFAIDGNSGRLFSVDDDLSDSLFSVNTIAGLPVIEAFADNTVVMGQYGQNTLVVKGNGDVGIGTANPQSKLHLTGVNSCFTRVEAIGFSSIFLGASGNIGVIYTNNSAPIIIDPAAEVILRTSSTERMRISTGGNVGIGTTSPSYKLHVDGTIYATGDVIAYSDARVKTNIRPIENVIERINNSRGVIYDRTDIESTNNIGFIAQELEQQFPELVKTDKEGKKSVAYQNAVAILFEAIKEQQKQIDNLTKLVNQLTK